jgi:hypothetical protein
MGERPVSVGRDAAATFVAGMQPMISWWWMSPRKKHVAIFMWKTMLKPWEVFMFLCCFLDAIMA